MQDLHDRHAFVTGGASGIGLGIARALVDAGARVALADLRPDHLADARGWFDARGLGDRVFALALDVTDRAAYLRALDEAEAAFGALEVLVNNAGVGITGPVLEASHADWDFGLGVNLGGVVNGLVAALPRMRAHGRGGHVVNTASLGGLFQMPGFAAIYATAKAGVITLSEALRGDLAAERIGVSVLCPGTVRSNIHELARNRPTGHHASPAFAQAADELAQRPASAPLWMDPDEVGRRVLAGIRADELYIITHGEFRPAVEARFQALLAAMPQDVDAELMRETAAALEG